jgi:Poly(ADP-ribose) polymerase catalytic domain/WWE domain
VFSITTELPSNACVSDGWYWLEDNGQWIKYTQSTVTPQTIEAKYASDPQGGISFTRDDTTYTVDFKTMVQTNNSTGKQRRVIRIDSNAPSSAPIADDLWFWQANDGVWRPFETEDSDRLERQFTADETATLSYKRNMFDYVIDFKNMQQKNQITGKVRNIRRGRSGKLTSSISRLHVGSKWLWEKDDGSWEPYDSTSGSISSEKLEAMFVSDPMSSFRFQFQGNSYVVDLKQMTQKNESTGKLRRIKRESPSLSGAQPPEPKETSSTSIHPKTWGDNRGTDLQVVPVNRSDSEYREVEQLFCKTMPGVSLKSVKRIQNPVLYERFHVHKTQLERRMGQGKGIMRLFHGTIGNRIDSICKQGFDFRLHTTHMYGKGSYFARDASYSQKYTDCNTMFLAQVGPHMLMAVLLLLVITVINRCWRVSFLLSVHARLILAYSFRL